MKTLIITLALTISLFLLTACEGSNSNKSKVRPEEIAAVNYQSKGHPLISLVK